MLCSYHGGQKDPVIGPGIVCEEEARPQSQEEDGEGNGGENDGGDGQRPPLGFGILIIGRGPAGDDLRGWVNTARHPEAVGGQQMLWSLRVRGVEAWYDLVLVSLWEVQMRLRYMNPLNKSEPENGAGG